MSVFWNNLDGTIKSTKAWYSNMNFSRLNSLIYPFFWGGGEDPRKPHGRRGSLDGYKAMSVGNHLCPHTGEKSSHWQTSLQGYRGAELSLPQLLLPRQSTLCSQLTLPPWLQWGLQLVAIWVWIGFFCPLPDGLLGEGGGLLPYTVIL